MPAHGLYTKYSPCAGLRPVLTQIALIDSGKRRWGILHIVTVYVCYT